MISIKENLGTTDRIIRLAIALIFLGLFSFSHFSLPWRTILLVLGTVDLFTAATAY
ncbi:MAG: DUF2892 domain-containing protein [Syntrophomonas sp.]